MYMRRFLVLMLLVSLAVSAYAGEKTTRILDKDDELTLYPMNHTGKYAASIAPAYPVRVECKATYQRNGKSTADIAEILTGISRAKKKLPHYSPMPILWIIQDMPTGLRITSWEISCLWESTSTECWRTPGSRTMCISSPTFLMRTT